MFEQRPQFIVALEPRRLVALIESSHRDAHNAGAAPLDQSDAAFELAAGFNPVVDHQDLIARVNERFVNFEGFFCRYSR